MATAGGNEMGILGMLNDPQEGTQDSEPLVYLENDSSEQLGFMEYI